MTTRLDTGALDAVDERVLAKRRALGDSLRAFGSICIGYSGGVDSAFLAKAAVDAVGPERVLAVTGISAAYPAVQREAAMAFARRYRIPRLEIDTDEVADPRYAANPTNRCYFCKSELWTRLADVARTRGLQVIADGSNADDAGDHRPGLRAAKEAGVRSPLLEVGLNKSEIRALSKAERLPTWERPSSPCLASRLPYGVAVTPERLAQVERAEAGLRALGFREFRVRHHADAARLEFAPAEIERAIEHAASVARAARGAGFTRVLLDVDGYRSGALNERLSLVPLAGRTGGEERRGNTFDGGRARRLASRLEVDFASVSVAGQQADIAVIVPTNATSGQRAVLAAMSGDIKALGFRYVAIELLATGVYSDRTTGIRAGTTQQ